MMRSLNIGLQLMITVGSIIDAVQAVGPSIGTQDGNVQCTLLLPIQYRSYMEKNLLKEEATPINKKRRHKSDGCDCSSAVIGGLVLGSNAWHAACSSRRGDYVAIFKPPVKVANKNAATTTHLLSPIVSHYYSYCWQSN